MALSRKSHCKSGNRAQFYEKNQRKQSQNRTREDLNSLLAEAMKQPGVKSILEVFEKAEKYARQSADFANYIDWQRFPSSSSACKTTQVA